MEQPVLDDDVIRGLHDLEADGNEGLLQNLIQMFFEKTPTRIAAMRQALAENNPHALGREAHALKGSCANLGLRRMLAICADLERIGRSGSLPDAEAMLTRLDREHSEARARLDQLLSARA